MITHLLAAELILEKIEMAKKPTPYSKWLHGTEAEKKLTPKPKKGKKRAKAPRA